MPPKPPIPKKSFGDIGRGLVKSLDDVAKAAADATKATAKAADDIVEAYRSGNKTLADTLKQLDELMPNGKAIAKTTGKSLPEVAEATKTAKKFLSEKSADFLVKAGVVAGGLAALMLLTGKKDPADALGSSAGKLAAGAGAGLGGAVGGGLGALFGKSGLSDFFSQWGLYIGLFCACLMMLGLFMMLK
jgi:hypothetical protein